MSLINQMLKDLEQRGAHANEPAKISLTAIHVDTKNSNAIPFVKLGLLIVLAAAGYYAWQRTAHPVMTKPSPAPNLTLSEAKPAAPQPANTTTNLAENNGQSNTQVNTDKPAPPAVPMTEEKPLTQPASLFAKTLQFNTPTYQAPAKSASIKQTATAQRAQVPTSVLPNDQSTVNLAELANTQLIDNQKPATKPSKETIKESSKNGNKDTNQSGKQMRPEQKSGNQYRTAVALLQQGRVSEAEESLKQALEANPANQEARQALAGLLLDNKRIDEAKSLLITGLSIHPEQIEFRMGLARLQVEAGERSNALATLEQGLPYANNSADYQSFIATMLQRGERHDEAISHYSNALVLNPNNTSALIGLGISAQATGKFEIAKEAFARAQTGTPLSTELSAFVEQRLKQVNQKLARLK